MTRTCPQVSQKRSVTYAVILLVVLTLTAGAQLAHAETVYLPLGLKGWPAPPSPTQTLTPTPTQTLRPTSTWTPSLPTPSPTATLPHGESDGLRLTVYDAWTCNDLPSQGPADPGNMYLMVTVLLENVSAGEGWYNVLYFSARDSRYDKFSSIIVVNGIGSGQWDTGDSAYGHIGFEVPTSSSGFWLRYYDWHTTIDVDLGL